MRAKDNRPNAGNPLTRHPMAALFVLSFICLLPAMLTRDFTPSNELRYLSIADEAIADGHVFAFYNHGIPYADKPPLYFWIVMLSRLLLGHHSIFVLSLFSILPAFGVVAVMDPEACAAAPLTAVAPAQAAVPRRRRTQPQTPQNT